MFKILIVDDEVLERKVLKKIVNDSSDMVKIIGEAHNGRKAIEMARELQPDIVFMDIKMPGINGVQAVKEIKKLNANIRFIMVSAFNTFEYAKEVMQQGVKEFILKPSSKKDILESLNRVSNEIIEERRMRIENQNLREYLNHAVSIAQKEWVSSLLVNKGHTITFDEWGKLLGMEINCGYMVLFSLHSFDSNELSEVEKQNWYVWLKNTVKSVVKGREIIIGPLTDIQVPVIILCQKVMEKSQIRISTQNNIERIFTMFKKEAFKGQLKIGVGRPYSQANELHKSYYEAAGALKLLENPNSRYFFFEKQELEGSTAQSVIFEFEKQLLDAVRHGDVLQVHYIYDSFILNLRLDRDISASFIKKSFDELFILISRMIHDLGISYIELPLLDEKAEVKELIEKGKTNLLAVVQHVQVWRNNQAKGLLQSAKEFIDNHYYDALTLEQVAEFVELSPFYFSKLFKDRFGLTFTDYLTELRIRKAKEEMADPAKSLKEICYSIGYKDPNYFSRVFKKITGLSPTEFRKTPVGS